MLGAGCCDCQLQPAAKHASWAWQQHIVLISNGHLMCVVLAVPVVVPMPQGHASGGAKRARPATG